MAIIKNECTMSTLHLNTPKSRDFIRLLQFIDANIYRLPIFNINVCHRNGTEVMT